MNQGITQIIRPKHVKHVGKRLNSLEGESFSKWTTSVWDEFWPILAGFRVAFLASIQTNRFPPYISLNSLVLQFNSLIWTYLQFQAAYRYLLMKFSIIILLFLCMKFIIYLINITVYELLNFSNRAPFLWYSETHGDIYSPQNYSKSH